MITQIKTWGDWNIIHDSYSDRFEARKTVDEEEIMKFSNSLNNLQIACDEFDTREKETTEKFTPVDVYTFGGGYIKQEGKITSISWERSRSVPEVRYKMKGEKGWSKKSCFSDSFALKNEMNDIKFDTILELNAQIKKLEEARYALKESMDYYVPPVNPNIN